MEVAIQLINPHPVLIHALQKIDFHSEGFSFRIMPAILDKPGTASRIDAIKFFLLDTCSECIDLGSLVKRCRGSCPGSKFVALIPPVIGNLRSKMRLFCWGIDGFVDLNDAWVTELPRAIDNILKGQLWVSSDVFDTFASHERTLLETHLSPGHSLTARERQVLHLLIRGLSNKDISGLIEISERTAKFHVSNILSKLQLGHRRRLLPAELRSEQKAGGPIIDNTVDQKPPRITSL